MYPEFGIKRELQNSLYLSSYKNTNGSFHFHSLIELCFVDEGEVEVYVNDKRRVLRAGELSVALSYDAHVYHSAGESLVSILFIPTYMCEEFLSFMKNKRAATPFVTDKKTVAFLRDCYSELAKDMNNNIKNIGYIYLILGTLAETLGFEDTAEPIDPALSSRILFYINEHYREDISLQGMSQSLGYNPSYISRYFKSSFKIGISQYITVIRLRKAVMLMQDKKNSITYCAFESGFSSIRTFYRAFLKEFGCTPCEYLKGKSE